jgi:uncharacterized protein YbjQ (UPF0145 family)
MENEKIVRAPYEVSAPRYSVAHHMVTTAFELHGFNITQHLGVVRGIVVRSRNLFVNIGAAFQSLVGGNITAWTKLCEQELGANAIIGARYDTTEISSGVTEVLAYGTAVIVEPVDQASYRS